MLRIRRPALIRRSVVAAPASLAQANVPSHLKVTRAAPAQHHAAKYGSAPRVLAAQGAVAVRQSQVSALQSQTLFPAPVGLFFRNSTGRTSSTAPHGSAPTHVHAGTMTGSRVLRPYGGPPATPLMVGNPRANNLGRGTVRMAIQAPPQTLIPNVMRKLFGR